MSRTSSFQFTDRVSHRSNFGVGRSMASRIPAISQCYTPPLAGNRHRGSPASRVFSDLLSCTNIGPTFEPSGIPAAYSIIQYSGTFRRRLPRPGLPPARSNGLLLRAEPSLVAPLVHLHAIVCAIARHMIDALAVAVDVALDRASWK